MRYSIDTSSLIDWHNYYPKDVFEKMWGMFTEACDNSILVAHEYVQVELTRKDSNLFKWTSDRGNFILPLDEEIQITASRLIKNYNLDEISRTGKIAADPFVISLAIRHNLTVVTEEKPGSEAKPKIPFICKKEGVNCKNIVGFMREMGWKFS